MSIQHSSLVGVFRDWTTAERAITELQNAGVRNDQIVYSTNSGTGSFLEGIKSLFTGQNPSAENLKQDLESMGLSSSEAEYYAQEYNAGHTIVAVNPEGYEQDVQTIFGKYGAYGYNSSQTTVNTQSGYAQNPDYAQTTTGYEQRADYTQNPDYAQTTTGYEQRAGYAQNPDYATTDEERSLKLREERLRAEKERVQQGEVRLKKDVVTEQQNIDVPVTHEEVYVERRPASGDEVSDTPIGEGETIRVPVSEERVNVSKESVVTGEVAIGKQAVEENQQVTDTVRHEKARLEKEGNPNIRTNDRRTSWSDRGNPTNDDYSDR